MPLRHTLDTLQYLRGLLREAEQCQNTPEDPEALAEVKRMLRHRLTELEVLARRQASHAARATERDRSDPNSAPNKRP
jgi:hypothetical protein